VREQRGDFTIKAFCAGARLDSQEVSACALAGVSLGNDAGKSCVLLPTRLLRNFVQSIPHYVLLYVDSVNIAVAAWHSDPDVLLMPDHQEINARPGHFEVVNPQFAYRYWQEWTDERGAPHARGHP
jgi:hypothetical protein